MKTSVEIMWDNINALRKIKGMTNLKLSEKLGVSESYLSKGYKRKTALRVDIVAKIAEIYGVGIEELISSPISLITEKKALLLRLEKVEKEIAEFEFNSK